MRRILTPPLFLFLLFLNSGCASRHHDLVGLWRLVESDGQSVSVNTVKIVTPTRFAFGREDLHSALWAGGGRVEVTSSVYSEIIEYHSKLRLVGKVLDFSYALQDGRWIHKCDQELDGVRFVIDEVWVRIED